MKKKLLYGFAVLAITVLAVFNMNLISQENGLSDVSLANVEALAQNEGYDCDDGYPHKDCKQWNYTTGSNGQWCTTGGDYYCPL